MSKKLKAIIPSVLLVVSITGGTYYYAHNNNPNNTTALNLLYYSSSDLNRAKIELTKLKVRTYSDMSWGANGRAKYFGQWGISEDTINSSKGNKSPDKWLPPENKCGYIIKWISVKYSNKLTITNSESETLNQKIKTCG